MRMCNYARYVRYKHGQSFYIIILTVIITGCTMSFSDRMQLSD